MTKFDNQASKAHHGSNWQTLCDSEKIFHLQFHALEIMMGDSF